MGCYMVSLSTTEKNGFDGDSLAVNQPFGGLLPTEIMGSPELLRFKPEVLGPRRIGIEAL